MTKPVKQETWHRRACSVWSDDEDLIVVCLTEADADRITADHNAAQERDDFKADALEMAAAKAAMRTERDAYRAALERIARWRIGEQSPMVIASGLLDRYPAAKAEGE